LVCACGLRFFPAYIGGSDVEFLSSMAVRFPESGRRYGKISKKYSIRRLTDKFFPVFAIVVVDKQFGYNRRRFQELNPQREVAKTIYGMQWHALPHNLD
jgi:hypothetical protein